MRGGNGEAVSAPAPMDSDLAEELRSARPRGPKRGRRRRAVEHEAQIEPEPRVDARGASGGANWKLRRTPRASLREPIEARAAVESADDAEAPEPANENQSPESAEDEPPLEPQRVRARRMRRKTSPR